VTLRDELDALPTKELHDRALAVAKRRVDVGFLWRLIEALPVAEAAVGDDQRSKVDVMRPLALINDLFDAGEGDLGEALRPMYLDYLEEHGDPDVERRTDLDE
jgi:hypothetical protein